MPSSESNKHKCNGDPQILSWYKMAQTKLKAKITGNLRTRAIIAAQTVNSAIRTIYHETHSHPLWSAICPNESIHDYQNLLQLPVFTIPQPLIDAALKELTAKVDGWKGVNVKVMNEPPKAFRKYWTTSDNWWNRYKAIWIGDYFFYPLLHDTLYQYMTALTKSLNAPSIPNYKRIAHDLLYFSALKAILFEKVTFNRARAQPLILDQAFTKSQYLHRFFEYLGQQHSVEWNIPPNDKNNKNRLHVRHYAQRWIQDICKQKQETYGAQMIRMNESSIMMEAECKGDSDRIVSTACPIENALHNLMTHNPAHAHVSTDDTLSLNHPMPSPCGPVYSYGTDEYICDDIHSIQSNRSTPQPYRPCRQRSHPYHVPRTHPYHVPPTHSNVNVHNTNAYVDAPPPQPQYLLPTMQPPMTELPNYSSMDTIESRDMSHLSGSILDEESLFGPDEMSMEFSCSQLAPFDGLDIFNQDFSDLDYQYL